MTPTLSLHHQADEAVTAAMSVMAAAFPPRFGEAWTQSQLSGMLDLPGSWMVLAKVADQAAGFALIRLVPEDAELLLIAVHPDHRRHGIGRAMMDRLLEEIRLGGATSLHIEMREGNEAAYFYEHYGFSLVGRRPGYYRGKDGTLHDALTYRLQV